MNYKVGDTVVCIDSLTAKGAENQCGLRAGSAVTVRSISDTCMTAKELPLPSGLFGPCRYCREPRGGGYWHIEPWRFIKLDGLQQETDTCTEATMRNQQVIPEEF